MGQVLPLRPGAAAEADLAERCLNGDADAWRTLYLTHVDRLEGFLRRMGVPPADVEDVLQDTFVALHRSLADYDGRFSFRTWLLGIAMNNVRSHRRRNWRRRLARLASFEGWSDPEAMDAAGALERHEAARELQWILDRLSDKQREVFVLYEIEGLDGYHLLHAARADLFRRLDRRDEAAASYRRALEMTGNEAERRYLEGRLLEVS